MKLDKLKFANLISYISKYDFNGDIETVDELCDIDVPIANQWVDVEKVDELLRQLNAVDGFIPAIKAYRVLTGAGLKESKEAIERYRAVPKFPKTDKPDTFGNNPNKD